MQLSAPSPPPQWCLSLVLHCLSRPPFESLANTSEYLLSLKMLFLVAITSARRASELAAFRIDPPFLQFHPDKVTLFPDVSFLSSTFYLSQPIILSTFFPSPTTDLERSVHLLDVRRALSFYISRTSFFRKSKRLFISPHPPHRGSHVSSQTISRWLVSTIKLAYQIPKQPFDRIKAHSTRATATSAAFLRGVSPLDICKAATWSTPSTFAAQYRLDLRAKADTSFGQAVISSIMS